MDEFRVAIENLSGRASRWKRLLSTSDEDSEDIVITTAMQKREEVTGPVRNIIEVESDINFERLKTGEKIILKITGELGWFVLVFVEDRNGWSCVRQTTQAPHNQFGESGTLHVPDQGSGEKYNQVGETTGFQQIVAVLTKAPFQDNLYLGLRIPSPSVQLDTLEIIATFIEKTKPDDFKIKRKQFYVDFE